MEGVEFLTSARYRFYARNGQPESTEGPGLPPGYEFRLFKPSWLSPRMAGLPFHPFTLYAALCLAPSVKPAFVKVYLVTGGGQVAHYSAVISPYFRFPFMKAMDLQIGPVDTRIAHRRKGLARAVLARILSDGPRNRFWWVVEESNGPSIALAESMGFELEGTGLRTRRLGLGILGQFELDQVV